MSHLQSGLEKMEGHLVQAEQSKAKWAPVGDIARENLQREIQHTKVHNSYCSTVLTNSNCIQMENFLKMFLYFFQSFQMSLEPLQRDAELVNELANQLQALHVVLSHTNVHKLEDYNTR